MTGRPRCSCSAKWNSLPAVPPLCLAACRQSCNVAGGAGEGGELALLLICTRVKTCNAGWSVAPVRYLAHLLPGYTVCRWSETSTWLISNAEFGFCFCNLCFTTLKNILYSIKILWLKSVLLVYQINPVILFWHNYCSWMFRGSERKEATQNADDTNCCISYS